MPKMTKAVFFVFILLSVCSTSESSSVFSFRDDAASVSSNIASASLSFSGFPACFETFSLCPMSFMLFSFF